MEDASEILLGKSMIHRLVRVSRRPVSMMMPVVCAIVTVVSVKVAVHPASQSWPMESREVSPSAGNKWTMHADNGSWGILSSAMWVLVMVVPSGSWTMRGKAADRTLLRPVA